MRLSHIKKIINIFLGKRKSFKQIAKENDIQIPKELLKKIKFDINIEGKNNKVIIADDIKGNDFRLIINIYGNNNTIKIDKNFRLSHKLEILMGQNHPNFGEVNNATFTIGENTGMEAVHYITFNGNSYCHIGKNCMFSFDIVIHNTDAHPIFDINTNTVINHVKGVTIGDHCWIGRGVTIMKNSVVPNDCIVGMNAVYSGNPTNNGEKDLAHCAFAGNPAKLIKRNITWGTNGAKCGYIENKNQETVLAYK